tara:strand:- start:89 stop:508 length:420 start_codon:yes stop_codon:yes gene_type:complete
MKKIIFSFILLFGATLLMPQSSFSQVVVKSKHNNSNKKVVVKKSNRHKGVAVKNRPTHRHPSRVVAVKPNRPKVIIKHPNRVRRNYIWVEGHWKWSSFYRDYIWIKGKWMHQRRGYHWQPGFWDVILGGFIWTEGCWVR